MYITLNNAPSIDKHPRTHAIAKNWLASLNSLEIRLSKENIQYLRETKAAGDPVPPHIVMNNHLALMEEIENSKVFFDRFLQ